MLETSLSVIKVKNTTMYKHPTRKLQVYWSMIFQATNIFTYVVMHFFLFLDNGYYEYIFDSEIYYYLLNM